MSKLKELGELEAAKKRFRWLDEEDIRDWPVGSAQIEDVVNFGEALIESVESLTAGRDELKKRVEELAAELRSLRVAHKEQLGQHQRLIEDHQKAITALQAARALAHLCENLFAFYDTRTMNAGLTCKLMDVQDQSREFLKMLDHPRPKRCKRD